VRWSAGAAAAVVSLSWMVAVSLVPAAGRGTYVDGSSGNSLFEQVFGLQRCSVGSVAASPFAGAGGQGLGVW
jgi:hypothetical protein